MNKSLAGAIIAATCRAIAIIVGGVTLCASLLGAIGFALVALYSALAPGLGPVHAAFATSGVALAVPVLVSISILIASRDREAARPAPASASDEAGAGAAAHAKRAAPYDGLDRVPEWISANPRTATLGALSLGVALGTSSDLRRTVVHGVDTALEQTRSHLH